MCIHVCLSACEARRGHQHPLELELQAAMSQTPILCKSNTNSTTELSLQPPKVILFSGGSTTAPKEDSLGSTPMGLPPLTEALSL